MSTEDVGLRLEAQRRTGRCRACCREQGVALSLRRQVPWTRPYIQGLDPRGKAAGRPHERSDDSRFLRAGEPPPRLTTGFP